MAEVREAMHSAIDGMRAAGVEGARLDAELLLAEAMGVERASLVADPGAEVPPPAARLFGEMVRRRLRREPVAYILGRRGFRNIELTVDRRVLIPRPETELLIEVALEREPRRVLDVGTGSGAIALALADELVGCEVTATDTSPAALEVARGNAARLGLAERVEFLAGSVPEGREFDLILANLPYVAETEWSGLQPEVTQWEPREALLAGADGLDAYRALIADLAPLSSRHPEASAFAPGAALALEVGEGQSGAIAALLEDAGFGSTEIRADLAGVDRVVLGER